jgi:hypothetical protein
MGQELLDLRVYSARKGWILRGVLVGKVEPSGCVGRDRGPPVRMALPAGCAGLLGGNWLSSSPKRRCLSATEGPVIVGAVRSRKGMCAGRFRSRLPARGVERKMVETTPSALSRANTPQFGVAQRGIRSRPVSSQWFGPKKNGTLATNSRGR